MADDSPGTPPPITDLPTPASAAPLATPQHLWYDFEEFASMAGFQAGLRDLKERGEAKWTNTQTNLENGGVHGLRFKIEEENGHPTIRLQHWVHWAGGKTPASEKNKYSAPDILKLTTETRIGPHGGRQIRVVSANLMGKVYTEAGSLMKCLHFLQETSLKILDNVHHNTSAQPTYDTLASQSKINQSNNRDEIPSLFAISQRAGLPLPSTIEGMSYNGQFTFKPAEMATEAPLYPVQLFRSMLGIERDIIEYGRTNFSRSCSRPNAVTGGYEGVTYSFSPDGDSASITCKIWSTMADGTREETVLYKISAREEAEKNGQFRLSELEMLGYTPNLNDHRGAARAIRAMKYINMAIQRGEPPVFSSIISQHKLKGFLSPVAPPTETADNPRTLLQVFGANKDAVFSEREKSIGSNGMVITRDYIHNDQWVRSGIGVDWGVTFGDGKKDAYHGYMPNYGRYLWHVNSQIEPDVNNILQLVTHEHEDHMRGIARMINFGYIMPPIVMNAHSKRVLHRMMGEEGVDLATRNKVGERCYVIDLDINNTKNIDPDAVDIQTIGKTVIERRTEIIWSESEQKKKHFPVLTVYDVDHPEGRTTIRVGPAGHSARAMMFDVAGVLYTGDYKLDQTIAEGVRTDLDWLAKCKDTTAVHIQESTNATKNIETNPTIAEVKANRKKLLMDEVGSRIIADMIGSNALDIEMFCRTVGEIHLNSTMELDSDGIKEKIAEYEKLQSEEDLTETGAENLAALRNAVAQMEAGDDVTALTNSRLKTLLRKKNGSFDDLVPYKYIIVAGTALRSKFSDLNVTEKFRQEMLAKYGVKIIHISSKKAQTILADKKRAGYVILNTGTQDEALSITHRVSRDLHQHIRLRSDDVIMRLQGVIPTDDNARKRKEQNDRYRHDFGCKLYDAVEMAKKGINIYTTSHTSLEDGDLVADIIGKDISRLVVHGGPDQLNAMKARSEKIGVNAIIPSKQVLYKVDADKKEVVFAANVAEERLGIKEIRADNREFFKRHSKEVTRARITDYWEGDVAERMYRFEQIVEDRAQARQRETKSERGSNFLDDFNDAATATANFPAIGIMHAGIERPYHEKHKGINVFVAVDTETSGRDAIADRQTDIAFVAADIDGNILGEKSLSGALPRYTLMSPGALIVTHNDNPMGKHNGNALRKHVFNIHKTYREWPQELLSGADKKSFEAAEKQKKEVLGRDYKKPESGPSLRKAKTVFLGWNNGKFDDPMTMRLHGVALAGVDMKPMGTQGTLQLDLMEVYSAILAFHPDKIKAEKDENGFYIRKLGSACHACGVEYKPEEAHDELYDARVTLKLFFKFKEIAPDLVEQMLMNTDFSTSRSSPMIEHIRGQGQHLNDQAPIFAYIDRRDRMRRPRLGAYVTTDTKVSQATDAIVVDLAEADIHRMERLDDDELLALMNDPKGPFAVIKMNNSAGWFPPQFVWNDKSARLRAVGSMPKSTILSRANALRHINTTNHTLGDNLIQRIERLYPRSALCRHPDFGVKKPVNENSPTKSFRLPAERIFCMIHFLKAVNSIENRHYATAAKLVRDLEPKASEFTREFNKEKFWKDILKRTLALSEETLGRDKHIEDLRFLVEWQIHDVCPMLLSKETRQTINALKSSMVHGSENAATMTVERFRKELEDIETNPDTFKKLVGEGEEAKAKWAEMKPVYLDYVAKMESNAKYRMTEAKREEVRKFRRQTTQKPSF